MDKPKTYVGVDNDVNGGMTTIGKIIRDAWVFGIIPETETCVGWNLAGIDALLQKVNNEWDKYGCLASHLPADCASVINEFMTRPSPAPGRPGGMVKWKQKTKPGDGFVSGLHRQ